MLLVTAFAGCGTTSPETAAPLPAPAAEYRFGGKIVLGSPRLTAGIPGTGPLTVSEIKVWLDDSKNHQPLDFTLPLGLRDAVAETNVPADNPLTRAKIELGRQLFFDKRLGDMSCAMCHQPRQSYSANQVFPDTGLNPLASFNRILSRHQFWNGKAASLEEQPIVPVRNVYEMRTSPEQLEAKLQSIEGYRIQFTTIFRGVTFAAFCKAVACFQRALVTGPSPYDYQAAFDRLSQRDAASLSAAERLELKLVKPRLAANPMSVSARHGQELFFSDRTGCGDCHAGPNFTDEQFHNLGVGTNAPHPKLGRFDVTGDAADKGAFKTPTLRNVSKTRPYMHDGSPAALDDVVEFFIKGGRPNPNLSTEIRPLDLTPDDKRDLIEFLKALDSPLPPV